MARRVEPVGQRTRRQRSVRLIQCSNAGGAAGRWEARGLLAGESETYRLSLDIYHGLDAE
jgi:hypothetical protein